MRNVLVVVLLLGGMCSAQAEVCEASWYGGKHHGRRTASGAIFNTNAMTAAMRAPVAFGRQRRVTNLRNGRSVAVTITDRGPFIRGRCIDLSRAAARAIGIDGVGRVKVE